MALEDRLKSQQYKVMLEKVKRFCQSNLSYTYVYGYKSHGYEHAEDVINNLEKLLNCYSDYKATLNEREIFILIISCYLHDIGMIIRNDTNRKDAVKEHNKNGWDYIKKYWQQIGAEYEYQQDVMDICYAHSDFSDANGRFINTLEDNHAGHPTIRAENRNWASLVRVSNILALEVKQNSISQEIYFQKEEDEKYKWLMRKKITNINFQPNAIQIIVNWQSGSNISLLDVYRIKIIFRKLIEDLNEKLNKCKTYLPNDINLQVVSSDLQQYYNSLNGEHLELLGLIKGAVKKANAWLISQKDKAWGKHTASRPRIATTAKTIIGLFDHKNELHLEIENKIIEAFKWTMDQHDVEGGFPAMSLKNVAECSCMVHCTAMAIYVYGVLCERRLINHVNNTSESITVASSIEWLLSVKEREKGWGNWKDQPLRSLCSYWSLRALKKLQDFYPEKITIDFNEELKNFIDSFNVSGKNELWTSCFFLILCGELNLAASFGSIVYKIINTLFNERSEDGLWLDNHETYQVPKKDRTNLTCNWTYHISALAIHALWLNYNFLNIKQQGKLFESTLALINNQNATGNFKFISTNEQNIITPTYESLNSLNKAMEVIAKQLKQTPTVEKSN